MKALRIGLLTLVAALTAVVAMAAEMTGVIVDKKCALSGNLSPDHLNHITADNPVVFVHDGDSKIYSLKNGSRAETLLGKHVTVQGDVEGSTIKVESIMEVRASQ